MLTPAEIAAIKTEIQRPEQALAERRDGGIRKLIQTYPKLNEGSIQRTTKNYSLAEVIENLVELVGIEPTTSSLRTMRSPS